MVVPDGVVEAERLVAATPLVTGAARLVDNKSGDVELTETSTESDTALATSDDEDVWLGGDTESGMLGVLLLLPCDTVLVKTVLGALGTTVSARLLVALELGESGDDCPALVALETEDTPAAADGSLKLEPSGSDTVGLGGLLGELEVVGLNAVEGVVQEVGDTGGVLDGGKVPREGDKVTPVRLIGEHL